MPPTLEVSCDSCGYAFRIRRDTNPDTVQCPMCGGITEIPTDAVGQHRTDPWNVVGCDECGSTFDYEDEEVQYQADSRPAT